MLYEKEKSSEIAIEVEGLGKCFEIYSRPEDRLKQSIYPKIARLLSTMPRNYYQEYWALRDINLTLKRGQAMGIVGRNGSGKSTLLQLICGTLTPTMGKVRVSGRIAALLELGTGFNPEFTGRENVYLNASILGLSRNEIDEKMDAILAFADIGQFVDQPVKTYSSGMMVRLAFSVSINVEPDILVIDEALAVGDAVFRIKCLDRLEEMISNGVTLLFVSHDIESVKRFCNKAIYLKNGSIEEAGSPHEVAEHYHRDNRLEQMKGQKGYMEISPIPPLHDNAGPAFAAGSTRVLSVNFSNTGTSEGIFQEGERVSLDIEVLVQKELVKPHISIIVQDRRRMELGGITIPILYTQDDGNSQRKCYRCEFDARFAGGRYFITLRIEERRSNKGFMPVFKQAGALMFEVHTGEESERIGILDLGMKVAEITN